jgi:hypothetical protein
MEKRKGKKDMKYYILLHEGKNGERGSLDQMESASQGYLRYVSEQIFGSETGWSKRDGRDHYEDEENRIEIRENYSN